VNNNGARLPIIESLVLSSPEPLSARRISTIIDDITPVQVEEAIVELNKKYTSNDLSFRIRKIAGGYQYFIIEDYARYVEDLLTRRRNVRLTRAALETLAIVAYRQPVTKIDIEMIRGVASDSVLHTLLEKKLITLAGRAETVGRPLLYKTTDEFLKYFNLYSIEDLPRMEEIEELLAAGESENQPSLPLNATGRGPLVEQPVVDDTNYSVDPEDITESAACDEMENDPGEEPAGATVETANADKNLEKVKSVEEP
jgi:segregation and condensation protein B